MEADIQKILKNARTKYDRQISIVYNGESLLNPFICSETFKNDLDFAKLNPEKFEEVPKAASSLAETSKKEEKIISEVKESLGKISEAETKARDEKFLDILDSIEEFTKEMEQTVDDFCEELKPMLKPFLYGTKNIERVEVLQSSFKNQKTLEEDLNYLDQIQKTETPENALANANSVLARHTKKKTWSELMEVYKKALCTKKSQEKPLELDSKLFDTTIQKIENKVPELRQKMLSAVALKQRRSKFIKILLENFDVPNGDITKLNCGLSKDSRISYCKGSENGCIGWGPYPLSIWGSNPYTEGSSYCMMGVHQGYYSRESGGIYLKKLIGNLPSFTAVTQNGVSSSAWGSYGAIEVSPFIE